MVQELKKSIKAGDIKPVYLFYGVERFLLEDCVNTLIKAIAPEENAFNLERVDALSASPNQIVSHANTMPFFASQKLLIVDNATYFANAKKSKNTEADGKGEEKENSADTENLLAYLENPSDTTVLLFIAGESINKAKKLTKAAAKVGTVKDFAPLKGNAAQNWLDTLLADTDKNMDFGAKQQLLLACDYNCTMINGELDKLISYVGGARTISLNDVDAIVSSNSTVNVFNLVDAVAAGDLDTALSALEQITLLEPAETIIPRLADHFQTLAITKVMQRQGYSTKEIMSAAGKSHPFVIEKAGRQAKGYSEKKLSRILETLLAADRKSKTGVATTKVAIETAMLQICLMKNS